MKASLKFREDQKPLFRAKVPLSILGMPFQSGVVAGDSNELALSLSTFFDSGPSLKFSYRPNDASNPFSLVLKSGTGAFGSPSSSSFLMTAEFNLLARGNNPSFMLHFKPTFGDFTIRKSHSSALHNKVAIATPLNTAVASDDDSSIEVVDSDSPVLNANAGIFSGKKFSVLPSEFPDAGSISGLLSGVEMSARTALPVKRRAVVKFRWGVRVPAEAKGGGGFSLQKIPFLVMNKIGIEHVDGEDSKVVPQSNGAPDSDVAATCLAVKRQLEFLQAENGSLRRAVEDLRHEISGGKSTSLAGDQKYSRKVDRRSNEKAKLTEGDASEELKKALMGATASGA